MTSNKVVTAIRLALPLWLASVRCRATAGTLRERIVQLTLFPGLLVRRSFFPTENISTGDMKFSPTLLVSESAIPLKILQAALVPQIKTWVGNFLFGLASVSQGHVQASRSHETLSLTSSHYGFFGTDCSKQAEFLLVLSSDLQLQALFFWQGEQHVLRRNLSGAWG